MVITLANATQRWLMSGDLKVQGIFKLSELQTGDYFVHKNNLCKMKVVSKYYCSYEDIFLVEHSTTDLTQKVRKVYFKKNENK